jgi:hypothetical protein
VLAKQLGDEPALAYTTLGLGTAAFFQNDLHRSRLGHAQISGLC